MCCPRSHERDVEAKLVVKVAFEYMDLSKVFMWHQWGKGGGATLSRSHSLRHALCKQESTHFYFLMNPPHAEKSGSDVCVCVSGHEHGCGAALSPALHSRP